MSGAEVAVVGAGIAGLACASELVRAGRDVVLLEAASRVGGVVDTRRSGPFLFERGPSTVRATAELAQLADAVGMALVRAQQAAPYVVAGGRLLRVPPSPGQLLTGKLLPLRGLVQLLGEPFRPYPPGPRSVHEFVAQRLGPVAADHLADLVTLGIYGAPSDEVGFEAAFPDLARELERHGGVTRRLLSGVFRRREGGPAPRGLVSTADGLLALTEAIARPLGERLRLGAAVRGLTRLEQGFELDVEGAEPAKLRARHVVLAVPAASAARLADDADAMSALSGFRTSPQTLATFTLEDPAAAGRWCGFGCLAPRREGLPLLGILFPSAIFPGRAPEGTMLLTVFVGPELRDAPDGELASGLAPVLQRLLEGAREPELLDVARYPKGIPSYDSGQPARTRAARARLDALGGPLLAGSPYDGVAFGAAASSGLAAARRLVEADG